MICQIIGDMLVLELGDRSIPIDCTLFVTHHGTQATATWNDRLLTRNDSETKAVCRSIPLDCTLCVTHRETQGIAIWIDRLLTRNESETEAAVDLCISTVRCVLLILKLKALQPGTIDYLLRTNDQYIC